jgi:hypothetical protein
MATPSPDDRFHHCVDSAIFPLGFDRGGPVWGKARTRCFFAPMHSSELSPNLGDGKGQAAAA